MAVERRVRVNLNIRCPQVRLISPDGEQLGIINTSQALGQAMENGLDLVEVAPNAKPPVCRIMDYGRYKYQQKKRAQDAKKRQTTIVLKEVKFRPKTEDHDFNFKVKHVRKFLEEGNKAKITMRFRGREITHANLGRKVLIRVAEEVKDVGIVEKNPSLDRRNMIMIIAPLKKEQ